MTLCVGKKHIFAIGDPSRRLYYASCNNDTEKKIWIQKLKEVVKECKNYRNSVEIKKEKLKSETPTATSPKQQRGTPEYPPNNIDTILALTVNKSEESVLLLIENKTKIQKQINSATLIQKIYRGYKTRKQYKPVSLIFQFPPKI